MEIVPGVHRIHGINGCNSYLLVGERLALVDTGTPDNGDAILSYIRSLGRDPGELAWIVVTHSHIDHSGSAQELHEATGALIVAHQDEAVPGGEGRLVLRGTSRGHWPPRWAWWRRDMHGLSSTDGPTEVHRAVEDGETLPCLGGLRLLHTPGHTPGSLCAYLPEGRILFVGDCILNNIDRLSRPLTFGRTERSQLDASLRRLGELEVDVCCFGHGPPLAGGASERIRLLTERPYDRPLWLTILKGWRNLWLFGRRARNGGHWEGGDRDLSQKD